MRNQMNRMLVILVLTGFGLLLGGCPGKPPQSNQNAPNQNASGQNTEPEALDKECESVSEKDIEDMIKTLSPELRQQFSDKDIEFDYVPAEKRLIFTGRVKGQGLLYELLDKLDKFQSKKCIIVMSFVGKESSDFEWQLPSTPGPIELCTKASVDGAVLIGSVKEQIEDEKNLKYNFDLSKKQAEFKNFIYGKKEFSKLMNRLRQYEKKGCVEKVIFMKDPVDRKDLYARQGFEWQICDGGQCSCDGDCKPCTLCGQTIDVNSNKNLNTNRTANNSNVP